MVLIYTRVAPSNRRLDAYAWQQREGERRVAKQHADRIASEQAMAVAVNQHRETYSFTEAEIANFNVWGSLPCEPQ
jgi:hypothetical protein